MQAPRHPPAMKYLSARGGFSTPSSDNPAKSRQQPVLFLRESDLNWRIYLHRKARARSFPTDIGSREACSRSAGLPGAYLAVSSILLRCQPERQTLGNLRRLKLQEHRICHLSPPIPPLSETPPVPKDRARAKKNWATGQAFFVSNRPAFPKRQIFLQKPLPFPIKAPGSPIPFPDHRFAKTTKLLRLREGGS